MMSGGDPIVAVMRRRVHATNVCWLAYLRTSGHRPPAQVSHDSQLSVGGDDTQAPPMIPDNYLIAPWVRPET
jgi:hypothetical protein